ncbi:dTDP-4-dehydrorhamnose reductase [Chloroflexota bacterium]
MRILLLGNRGQLGWELNRTLLTLGDVATWDYPDIDLTQPENVTNIIADVRPEIIINATAYTAVDRAESEPEIADAINHRAPAIMAEQARDLGLVFIHYSTDYVFDGTKGSPYTEEDAPNPLNVYGHSKLAGEIAISQVGGAYLILRTSWVYSLRRDSFVTKVLRWSREHHTLRIVSDQVSNPTWARTLAEISAQLLSKGDQDLWGWITQSRGIYHLACDGYTSRLQWAEAIIRYDPRKQEQITQIVEPAKTTDFPTAAQRPRFSALDCSKFKNNFGLSLPGWELSLKLAMQDQGKAVSQN